VSLGPFKLDGSTGSIFVAKLGSDGSYRWVRSFKSTRGINDMALDAKDNIYVTGRLDNSAIFDSFTLVAEAVDPDRFIVKLDPTGHALWAKAARRASLAVSSNTIGVDSKGDVFIAGSYRYEAHFESFAG
jgi:hypothetical protein